MPTGLLLYSYTATRQHCGRIERKHSWNENFAAAGYSFLNPVALDMKPTEAAVFPLLTDPARYVVRPRHGSRCGAWSWIRYLSIVVSARVPIQPDTVDLNGNEELREFWIAYFQRNLGMPPTPPYPPV
jgi:hypothetical protein